MPLQDLTADVLAEATSRRRRNDPVRPGTGGPAGNARLTAWLGLILLVLFGAETLTLLDVNGLISWHVAVGVLLVPPAVAKTGTTGWRILRYYTGDRAYRAAGAPPMLLRLLGPLVILGSLGVLGSGLTLIALGSDRSRHVLLSALGQRVDAVTVHQAFFAGWAVVISLHVLARIVPAVVLAGSRAALPGRYGRLALVTAAVLAAAVAAYLLVGTAASWRDSGHHRDRRDAPAGFSRTD